MLNAALDEVQAAGGDLWTDLSNLHLDSIYDPGSAQALVVDETQTVVVGNVSQDCVATSDTVSMITRITRSRWKDIASLHVKEGIALHEALVLKRIEGTGHYPISSKFLARFGIAPASLLSGNPEPSVGLGKVLTVQCKPKARWRVDAGDDVKNLYLVFDGTRGLMDPALVVTYRTDSGLPPLLDSIEATLDSDTPGKINYRIGASLGGGFAISPLSLSFLTFDFKAMTIGTAGNGSASEKVQAMRGIDRTPVTHDLSCLITDSPPKN